MTEAVSVTEPGEDALPHDYEAEFAVLAVALARPDLAGLIDGITDILIIARGQAFCIELKRPGKKAEAHQRAMHETLRRCGAPVAVCTSVEEVAGTLDGWRIPTRGGIAV